MSRVLLSHLTWGGSSRSRETVGMLGEFALGALLTVVVASAAFPSQSAAAEVWVDASGKHRLTADFVALSDGIVKLKTESGKIKKIPIAKLDEASQSLAKKLDSQNEGAGGSKSPLETLNATLKQGISAEDNVVVALLQAVGYELVDSEIRTHYLREIGIDPSASAAAKFILWEEFAADHTQGADAPRSPLESSDNQLVDQWLAANNQSLDLVDKAMRKSKYYSPLIVSEGQEGMTAIVASLPFRNVAQGLAARSRKRLREDDLQGAVDSTFACFRLARLMSSEATLVGNVVALAIEQTACESIEEISAHENLDLGTAKQMIGLLDQLPPPSTVAAKMRLGEKALAIDRVHHISQGGPASFFEVTGADRGDAGNLSNRWTGKSLGQFKAAIPKIASRYDQLADLAGGRGFENTAGLVIQQQRLEMETAEVNEFIRSFLQPGLPNVKSGEIAMVMAVLTLPTIEPHLELERAARGRAELIPTVVLLVRSRIETATTRTN